MCIRDRCVCVCVCVVCLWKACGRLIFPVTLWSMQWRQVHDFYIFQWQAVCSRSSAKQWIKKAFSILSAAHDTTGKPRLVKSVKLFADVSMIARGQSCKPQDRYWSLFPIWKAHTCLFSRLPASRHSRQGGWRGGGGVGAGPGMGALKLPSQTGTKQNSADVLQTRQKSGKISARQCWCARNSFFRKTSVFWSQTACF